MDQGNSYQIGVMNNNFCLMAYYAGLYEIEAFLQIPYATSSKSGFRVSIPKVHKFLVIYLDIVSISLLHIQHILQLSRYRFLVSNYIKQLNLLF